MMSSSSSSSSGSVLGSGQSLQDRVNSFRHSIAGQGVHRVVCKATTEEMLGPKKKHLDYLLQCTHEPNVSIPSLANLLIDRATTCSNWVVVFKSLITVHHLMCYGNERLTQYLATASSSASVFPPSLCHEFADKVSCPLSIEMSAFVRRYSKFLNAKAAAYRSLGCDPARIRSGGLTPSSGLRNMSGDQILKTLPVMQNLLDSLLEFDAHPRDLSNGVMTSAFVLLYRDLIRLFACFNDGIINLLEKFFSFRSKRETRSALDLYKRFLIRMDRVAEFLKTAEAVGIDKGDIPDLTRAPSSLLQALESHVAAMESSSSSASSQSQLPVTASKQSSSSSSSTMVPGGAAAAAALEEEARYLSLIAAERQQKQHQQQTLGTSRQVVQQSESSNKSLEKECFLLEQDSDSGNLMTGNNSDFHKSSPSSSSSSSVMTRDILSLFESNSASCLRTSSSQLLPQQQQQQQQQLMFPPAAGLHNSNNPFSSPSSSMMDPLSSSSTCFQANFASAFPSASVPSSSMTMTSSLLQPSTAFHHVSSLNQQINNPTVVPLSSSSASSSVVVNSNNHSSLNSLPGIAELFPSFSSSNRSLNQNNSMMFGGNPSSPFLNQPHAPSNHNTNNNNSSSSLI